jgi:hypothetical protein
MRHGLWRALGISVLVGGMIAAAAPAPAQAPAPDQDAPALTQSVADAHGRFTMRFPADWEVATQTQGMVALFGAGSATGGSRPTVNVVTEAFNGPMTPEGYAAAAERLTRVALHNYTRVKEANTTVQGRPAFYRFMTWETNSGVTLYQLQVFITEGLTGFVVTGSTVNEPERVSRDMPLIIRIIETFRVTPAQATN